MVDNWRPREPRELEKAEFFFKRVRLKKIVRLILYSIFSFWSGFQLVSSKYLH